MLDINGLWSFFKKLRIYYLTFLLITSLLYIVVNLYLGKWELILWATSEQCNSIEISSDVKGFSQNVTYSQILAIDSIAREQSINISSRTKLLSIKICPNSQLTIEKIKLLSLVGSEALQVNEKNGFECINCEMITRNHKLLITSSQNSPQVNINLAKNIKNYNILALYFGLRYLPYLLFINYLFLFTIYLPKKDIYLTKLFCYSGIIIAFIILLHRKFRTILVPEIIGKEKIMGYSQYHGVPVSFDYLIYFAFLLVPAVVAFLFFVVDKLTKKKK